MRGEALLGGGLRQPHLLRAVAQLLHLRHLIALRLLAGTRLHDDLRHLQTGNGRAGIRHAVQALEDQHLSVLRNGVADLTLLHRRHLRRQVGTEVARLENAADLATHRGARAFREILGELREVLPLARAVHQILRLLVRHPQLFRRVLLRHGQQIDAHPLGSAQATLVLLVHAIHVRLRGGGDMAVRGSRHVRHRQGDLLEVAAIGPQQLGLGKLDRRQQALLQLADRQLLADQLLERRPIDVGVPDRLRVLLRVELAVGLEIGQRQQGLRRRGLEGDQHLLVMRLEAELLGGVRHGVLHEHAAPRLGFDHPRFLVAGIGLVLPAIHLALLGHRILEVGVGDVVAVDRGERARHLRLPSGIEAGAEEEDESADEGEHGHHHQHPPDQLDPLVAHAEVLEHCWKPLREVSASEGRSASLAGPRRNAQ